MDDIQRKLAAIDAQLTAGPLTSFKQISATAPLLFAATGLMAGILIQNTLSQPQVTGQAPRIIYFWLILLALSATAAVLIFTIPKAAKLGPFALVLLSSCAFICFTCLGAVRLITFNHPPPNDIRNLVTDQRTLATIRGSIITDPYIDQRRWEFAKFLPTDPSSSFYLRLSEVETTTGWANVTGTVRVRVDEPVLDLKTSDHIQAYCWLDTFKPPTNPGQFNIAQYLARRNIFIAASIKSREGIEVLQYRSKSILTKAKTRLRQTATSTLVGHLSPEDRNRALLEALLLGYRSNIDSATYRAFRITGLLHFISLSGMHLGILIGFVWYLCKLAGLMKRFRAIVCFIAIFIFLLIVPPRAPTVRAAIIGFVFCASLLFRRKASSLNTLSLAAIILLLIRPTQLFEAGWQLSFASVLGILLFCRRTYFFLYEKIAALPWPKEAPVTKQSYYIISRPGPYILALFTTGLTAWLGGAGILLYHFYTINPLTCLWTIIAFPLVLLILTIGYTKIILSLLLPTIAALLGTIVSAFATALIWIVERISAIGISQILIGRVPLAPIILYYCLILFATSAFRRPRIKTAVCTVMAVTLIAFLGLTKYQRTYRNDLLLTCLDVGHGQAIFAQLPGKANILFDAGSLYKGNIGQRILAPFLDYIGTNTIDAIIISHNDVDHLNGIPEIIDHCRVGDVYANDAFFSEIDPSRTAKFLQKSLSKRGLLIKPLRQNLDLTHRADITMLWPNHDISHYEQLSDNDKSQVSMIEFAGTKILLCSDIEQFAQKQLLHLFPNLKADVLIAPHHGSARTAAPDFLQKINLTILICSCGRRAYENHLVVKPTSNARAFYTAADSAVIVRIDNKGNLHTRTFIPQK